ncbi:MAG: cysteine desulfurase family protein [Candidatus Nanopelagicaceae bacterium]|nr:cysteine desulfurase family protein [Candidatus Nanopelagicaceae bacterium]
MALRSDLIYLDYNATTPVDSRVSEVIMHFLTFEFGNPSSTHVYGESARIALEQARNQIATLIGASPSEIVFTGSGSEADALAIRGAFLAARADNRPRSHLITQVTEHPAVLAACRELEDLHGVTVTYLPVDEYGRVDPVQVERAITSETFLISIMHANNEIGTLQPITQIASIAKSRGVLMHCDAAQSVGKIPVNVGDLGVDLLTIVGHKMYAPKGIAALYVRNGIHLRPIVGGGGQEHGLRAGTENVAFALGFGKAAELAAQSLMDGETERLTVLRNRLERLLHEEMPEGVHFHGHPTEHLPNTVNMRIDGVPALALLAAMSGVAASAGSACHAGRDEPSSVLIALGLSAVDALATIRLSLGRWSTENEIDEAARQIVAVAQTFTNQ